MLVFLPVTIAVLAFYQLKGALLYRKVLANFDGLNQVLQENMAGVRVVQAFVRKDYESSRFDSRTPSSSRPRPRPRARRRSSTRRSCS